jgi:phosphohistidine phosphatase
MLRLMLLRHAKAERSRPGEKDHERVLAERGRDDAPKLGAYMIRHAFVPDHVVVSTSTRTRETWELVAGAFKHLPPVEFDRRIYEASPQAILNVIKEADSQIGTLLVVGHNPGLQELATQLVAVGDTDALRRLKEEFPTSALAVISFMVDGWSRVHGHAGRLEHFVTSKQLATATD